MARTLAGWGFRKACSAGCGPKIAARGIWGSSDWCASTLHNRHTGRGHGEFEMSGDPGRWRRAALLAVLS